MYSVTHYTGTSGVSDSSLVFLAAVYSHIGRRNSTAVNVVQSTAEGNMHYTFREKSQTSRYLMQYQGPVWLRTFAGSGARFYGPEGPLSLYC